MKLRHALVILILPVLAACGIRGSLSRPPPMFGEEKARYQAELERQQAAEAAEKKAPKPPGGDAPLPPPPVAPIGAGPLAPPPAP